MAQTPLLELKQIAKVYPATEDSPETPVLQNVNLEVSNGETLAIVGPSGSGKSTLLNIIGTLDRPTKGTVVFNGKDLSELKDNALSSLRSAEIGWVFQLHHLLPQCTALENVLVPTLALKDGQKNRKETAQRRAERLMERVGLSHRMHHKPGQLSGGERQRVAVVRSLINEPVILLADEPTGALDSASAETLANLLVELNREEGVAMIVITHSMSLAERMSRILEMRNGSLYSVEQAR